MRVAIIGRTEILYECAQEILKRGHCIPLIVTSKEAPEYKITSKDFENLAEQIGAKFIYTPKINEEKIIEEIKNLDAIDIAVSINYTGVMSQDVINLFDLGILNAHGGDLPKYRGNACQAWAIINREKRIGLCIHKMMGGELDSGDIIERDFLDIDINNRIGEVYQWMESKTPLMMVSAIDKLAKNSDYILEKQSKNPKDALRCYPRMPEDGKIDWSLPAEDILRLVNASSEPFSGAFCTYMDKKLIIWRASLISYQTNYLAVPGQVIEIEKVKGYVDIACRLGEVRLELVEYEGSRVKPSSVIKSIRKRLS
jgi:methionyl-tRNA formyltransferase